MDVRPTNELTASPRRVAIILLGTLPILGACWPIVETILDAHTVWVRMQRDIDELKDYQRWYHGDPPPSHK